MAASCPMRNSSRCDVIRPRKYTSDESLTIAMNWFTSDGSTWRMPCGITTSRIESPWLMPSARDASS